MRAPRLPKAGPWTEEDAAHLEKVLATFPAWNSEQIALMRRISAASRPAAQRQEEAA